MEQIADFLESYGDENHEIVIFEAAQPNYVIASSTGSPLSTLQLSSDTTKPCPDPKTTDTTLCTALRKPMSELTGHPMDKILVRAYHLHNESDYPEEELSVTENDDIGSAFYVSQSALYVHPKG